MDVDQIVGEQQQQIVQRLERTGAHSHIRGLGLDDKLEPIEKVCFLFLFFTGKISLIIFHFEISRKEWLGKKLHVKQPV